jgi:hypothetical protein
MFLSHNIYTNFTFVLIFISFIIHITNMLTKLSIAHYF